MYTSIVMVLCAVVGDLAMEHMASKMPSPTQEDYLNASNVVVIHSQKVW